MRPTLEVADIVRAYGDEFRQAHAASLSARQKRVLRNIELCRTVALGGHLERCDQCGHERMPITRARTAIAPSASPWPEPNGWKNANPNFCRWNISMWCLRCQNRSPSSAYRINRRYTICCFERP